MNLFKDYNLNTFKLQRPPADNSMQTFKELQDLNKIPINRSFVEEKDDIVGSFKKITENAGLPYPEEEVTKLQDDSSHAIKKLKNYYNRPRPHVLAGSMGMKLDNVQLNSMKTPSYPSGHSAQSKLIANVLSDKYPELKEQYQNEAKQISDSRNVGRAHYKSDSTFGTRIGDDMYNYLKQNNYGVRSI